MNRRILPVVVMGLSACGGGATSPSSTDGGLPYQAGTYFMDVLGGSLECGDVKNPQAGTSVTFMFTMRADPTGWTGTTDSGNLVLHFQPTTVNTNNPPFAIPVAGTATGFVDDQGYPAMPGMPIPPPTGTRVTFQPSVQFLGGMPLGFGPDFSTGTFNGTVVFSRNGVTSTCPSGAVSWTLNRLRQAS